MHRYEIRIGEDDYERLRELLWQRPGIESAAFLLAGVQRSESRKALLGRRVLEVPEAAYDVRTASRIELSTRATNGLAALCEAGNLTAVLCHSHPFDTSYSASDDHGERRIAEMLRQFTGCSEVGSLLLTPTRWFGRIWTENEGVREAERLVVVGRQLRAYPLGDQRAPPRTAQPAVHDRQIRAFGEDGQTLIEKTKVGIVGVGGTGSAVTEQIVRLGVRDLVLIDMDEFDASSLSRMYGTHYGHVKPGILRRLLRTSAKVDLIKEHAKRINPRIQVRAIKANVASREVLTELLDRDIVFACTDDHWGRSVLNQLAYQYLIPVVNIGVALDSKDGKITAGNGVVQVLRPGCACLWCSEYLSSERVAAESFPDHERTARVDEGYLGGFAERAPSVVPLTTTVAGLACMAFLQLITDFMGETGKLARQNYLMLEGVVRSGWTPVRAECVCRRYRGYGDQRRPPTPI